MSALGGEVDIARTRRTCLVLIQAENYIFKNSERVLEAFVRLSLPL